MKVDVVLGLQQGDEAKGKLTHYFLGINDYDYCMRYNGGHNAGHAIYYKGQRVITHIIPAGVFHNVKSIIGSGCVVNPKKFFKEIEDLEKIGVPASKLVKISHNTHIIQQKHIDEDSKDTKIGTTRSGNGPAFRDKYARVGIRAEQCPELKDYIVNVYDELFKDPSVEIIMEGAQGVYLCPDSDNYPYTTSSHCSVAAAIQNGVPYSSIRNVYGAAKVYETYSGFRDDFQGNDPILDKIAEVGKEVGNTTNRKRKIRFLNLEELVKAINMNGVTHLIMSKVDILREIGVWKFYNDESSYMEDAFKSIVRGYVPSGVKLIWSERPDGI